MVGVPVATVEVIGDQNIGLNIANGISNSLGLRGNRLGGQGIFTRLRVRHRFTVFAPRHAGITVDVERARRRGGFLSQEETLAHTQLCRRVVELNGSVLPQCLAVVAVAGFAHFKMLQLRRNDFSHFASGEGQQMHLGTLLGVVRHRCACCRGLVVWMRVHEQHNCLRGRVAARQ